MKNYLEKSLNMLSSDKKQNKIIALIFYILFSVILCGGYLVASKPYLSFNFFVNPGEMVRALKILPAYILIIWACIFLIPDKIKELAHLYWFLFTILSSIPILIVYVFNGIADNKNVLIYIYTIEILCVIGMYLVSKLNIRFPNISLNKRIFWTFIFMFMIIAYGYLFKTLGLPKNIKLAFKDVYTVRLNYRKVAGRFDDYFIQWMGNVLNPFILTYCIYKKKYKLAPLPIFLELILYSYTAYKSLFVTLILAPLFGLLLNRGVNKSFIQKSIVAVAFIALIDGTISMVKQFSMVSSKILSILNHYPSYYSIYLETIVRAFIWPSLIALEYYDFFWMYPKVRLSHSIFSHFFTNVYRMEPALYLGALYYGRPDMRLNVTWYGDAYMNFGIIGVIVFAVLLYIILLAIKHVEKKNVCLVASLLFGGLMSLFNGPLLTTLLTSGLGIGLFLAYILPENI
jgi:oligosaccharide repeat unit polymerase